MMELKNILVPIDFSKNSYDALEYAVEIAQLCSARLSILHSYRLILPDTKSRQRDAHIFKKELESEIEGKFEKILSSLLEKKVYEVDCTAHLGFTEDTIEAYVSTEPVDLVVMGMLGQSGRKKAFGSTLTAVVKNIPTPVIAVPWGTSFTSWNKVFLTQKISNQQSRSKSGVPDIIKMFQSNPEVVKLDSKNTKSMLSNNDALSQADLLALDTKEYSRIEEKFNKQEHPERKLYAPLLIA